MAAKKTASKKAPAKSVPPAAGDNQEQAQKPIDPEIIGRVTPMVKRGRSHEAVKELVESAKISEAEAMKVVYRLQHHQNLV